MKRTVVITGANRGIGLGLTRYFVLKGDFVIATVRDPASARDLTQIKNEYPELCVIETLDVKSEVSAKALAAKCADYKCVDLLINNAGIMIEGSEAFPTLGMQTLSDTFNVNTLGPIRLTQAFLGLLSKSSNPTVVNISSKMGSIADNTSGGSYAYRMSKAALNMFSKSFSIDYPKITSVVFHPGWVKTDMGGAAAPTEVEESTAGLGKQIDALNLSKTGKFFDFNGRDLPW